MTYRLVPRQKASKLDIMKRSVKLKLILTMKILINLKHCLLKNMQILNVGILNDITLVLL